MAAFEQPGLPTKEFEEWWPMFLGGSQDYTDGTILKAAFEPLNKQSLIDSVILPYSCGMCKRGVITGTDLSACASCKCVRYCGKECQKEHYKKGHKQVCGVLKTMVELAAEAGPPAADPPTPQSNADWNRTNMNILMGKGPLPIPAGQYFLRRPHCFKCCSTEKKTLVECRVCHGIAHCKAEACETEFNETAHTREDCEKNALILAAWVMKMQQGGSGLKVPSLTREETAQFPSDWAGYFAIKQKDFEVPDALLQMPPVTALLTSTTTNLLTAMHALTHFVPGSRELETIRIHFLGCNIEDLMGSAMIYEEIFHWFPNLRTLEVRLIGPEVTSTPVDEHPPACAACRKLGCRVTIGSEAALYHASAEAQQIASAPPTLVLAQNSGLHEMNSATFSADLLESYNESWLPTLRLLAEHGIPAVFTSYNKEEAAADAAVLTRVFAKAGSALTVQPPVRNPFRSLLPRVEPTDPTLFYYNSDYATFCS